MIDGVAQVQVFGSAKYAVRVQLDPDGARVPADRHRRSRDCDQRPERQPADRRALGPEHGVHASGERPAQDAAEFREMTVAYRNGAAVHLGALGRVLDDIQNNKSASWFNGTRAIVLAIQRQPNTNTVAVAKAVNATLDSLRATDPGRRERRHAVRPIARHRAIGARREDDAAC